MQRLHYVIF